MAESDINPGGPVSDRPTAVYLSRHAHLQPDDGVCLMEWVSQQAGERFSDSPRCTHPLLAEIARIINDALDDGPRQRLVSRAAWLTGTASRHPSVTGSIMHASVQSGLDSGIASRRLVRAGRRMRWTQVPPVPRPSRWSLIVDALYQRGPARNLVHHIVHRIAVLPEDRREAALVALLDSAIVAATMETAPSRSLAAYPSESATAQ